MGILLTQIPGTNRRKRVRISEDDPRTDAIDLDGDSTFPSPPLRLRRRHARRFNVRSEAGPLLTPRESQVRSAPSSSRSPYLSSLVARTSSNYHLPSAYDNLGEWESNNQRDLDNNNEEHNADETETIEELERQAASIRRVLEESYNIRTLRPPPIHDETPAWQNDTEANPPVSSSGEHITATDFYGGLRSSGSSSASASNHATSRGTYMNESLIYDNRRRELRNRRHAVIIDLRPNASNRVSNRPRRRMLSDFELADLGVPEDVPVSSPIPSANDDTPAGRVVRIARRTSGDRDAALNSLESSGNQQDDGSDQNGRRVRRRVVGRETSNDNDNGNGNNNSNGNSNDYRQNRHAHVISRTLDTEEGEDGDSRRITWSLI